MYKCHNYVDSPVLLCVASDLLKLGRDAAETVTKRCPLAFQCVSKNLQADRLFIFSITIENIFTLNHIRKTLRNDAVVATHKDRVRAGLRWL